jgi:phosphoglycolate phosphatase-like HAD superfamily hydrolase
MRYDAVLFDCDGVLVEPTDPAVHREAVRAAFRSFGVEDIPSEIVDQLVEITGDDRDQLSASTVETICAEHDIDPASFWYEREALAAEAQLQEVAAGRKDRYVDIDMVRNLRDRDQRPGLGVISNNQHELLGPMLEHHDMADTFDAYYGREPTLEGLQRRKPNPYHVRQVLGEIGADEPVLIGDSDVDIRTADQLSIDSVFLRRPHRQSYELSVDPTYEIRQLTELPEVL